jgi:cysteine desulfurase family protein
VAEKLIYLDNAATTFPKPAAALRRAMETYIRMGVSPGRGSYDMATEAERLVNATRAKVAGFFGSPVPERVIFTANATDALNIALQGVLRKGDHVVSTRLEHNSVLRPLFHLREKGLIDYDLVPFDACGFVDPEMVGQAIRSDTRLVCLCHASNVLGTIQPVREIARLCAEKGVPLLLDAAQTAGVIPIDMKAWGVSALAFTGHKSMLAPTGIGGLILDEGLEIEPTRFGGTGVDSKTLVHTPTFPHRLEAGTLNLLGIIGLSEGMDFLQEEGMETIRAREGELLRMLRDGLTGVEGIELYCAEDLTEHVGILLVNVKGMEPEDVCAILDGDFGICVRVGLQCAPLAHEDLGTSPAGAVRFSLGPFNTEGEIKAAIEAMTIIAKGAG